MLHQVCGPRRPEVENPRDVRAEGGCRCLPVQPVTTGRYAPLVASAVPLFPFELHFRCISLDLQVALSPSASCILLDL
jgi:hypothetical protein